jgi:hypothetical protein
MVYFLGNRLRASTLQIAGEYHALTVVFWGFWIKSIFRNDSANGTLKSELIHNKHI